MLAFTPITEADIQMLASLYQNCNYKISDYSLGIKWMWKDLLAPEYTVAKGCLVVRSKIRGRYAFDFPLPLEDDADIQGALLEMADFCSEKFLPFEMNAVLCDRVPDVFSLFPNVETRRYRNLSDYLYLASDFRDFTGKRFAGQRNHIRKFHTNYPQAVFRRFDENDAEKLHIFREKFESSFEKTAYGAKNELNRAFKMLKYVGSPFFRCGGFELDGEIISFCLAEKCGDTLIDHIEKALPDYEGIYPAMVQEFAKTFTDDVLYINREDDAGDRGLRTSKTQYHPTEILEKIQIRLKNELYYIEKIPKLRSLRLTMDAIKEEDIPDYNRLCLDDERNRFWGYDYREDCENPDEDYFYLDQKKDFGASTAMNFAIRLNGKFIGEILLYHFDFRGGAEIGIRIFAEYEGEGYATEAFTVVCNYALYQIGMYEIRAKCMKENLPSKKMLSAIMRLDGEDDTYFYFRKNV
ncbi:MAG: GNAT family N-acetyltransferase [Clostridia bacterium]|nr:GNAT family N-acetyltransferase [Clostridia bacterium]